MSARAGINVLIALGDETTRGDALGSLERRHDLRVVGVVQTHDEALAFVREHRPDVILVDESLPGRLGVDTITAVTALFPHIGAILLAPSFDTNVLRRAMIAGAREVLQTPIAPDALRAAVQRAFDAASGRYGAAAAGGDDLKEHVSQECQTIAVFSPKGGVGTTTIASSLAVAIREEARLRVALVDGSLPFGDIGVLLDLPNAHSLVDLRDAGGQLDAELVESAMQEHRPSGVKVLLSPGRPELAEQITSELLRQTLLVLRSLYDYVVVDTWPALDDRVLTILDVADKILLVTSLDMTSLRHVKAFLQVASLLQYPSEKIVLVMTRATSATGLSVTDVEEVLGRRVDAAIPTDERQALKAANVGTPVVSAARGTPIGVALTDLARQIVAEHYPRLMTDAQTNGQRRGPFRLRGRS